MWDSLVQTIKDIIQWIWDHTLKPIWALIWSFFSAIVSVVVAIIAFIRDVAEWILDMIQSVLDALGDMLNIQQAIPDFSGSSGILADINIFLPVREFFAMLTVTFVLLGLMLLVRFIKWVREMIIA